MSALLLLAAVGVGCGAPDRAEVSRGDTTLRARADGSFDLVVGGRNLLSGRQKPVALLDFAPSAPVLWGQFDYETGPVKRAAASRLAAARSEGGDLVLALDGEAAATLRFTRRPDEVTITIRATAPGLIQRGLELAFACEPAARFLGFGEQYHAIDHRGEAFPLFVSEQGIGRNPEKPGPYSGNPWTTYYPVPFFLDPRGFGLAVDTPARVTVDLCKSSPEVYTLTVDEPGEVTLHLYTGPTVGDVLRAFTVLHGRTAPAPRWSVDGAWLGVQGGPARVEAVVARAKQAGVPVAAVWVQDWVGRLELGGGLWELQYHWTADTRLYPDLPGLISRLHAQKVRFLGYFNPFVLPNQDQWAEATANGYLPLSRDGKPYQFLISVFEGSTVDLTNPAAVTWFQAHARRALAMGMDGWMDDFGEWLPYDARIHQGDAPREHQLYPARWHKASRDLLTPEQLIFSRSGWLGDGHAAQIVWIGDQEADWSPWDGLPTVVPAMISLGLVGVGFVTHDVAGFSGGPSTRELYLRWLELGAFTPILRTHEGLAADNNWRWDNDGETLAAFSRFARVHQRLADTFMKLGEEFTATGMPIVRALALGWPDDPRAVGVADEYTIGGDLLVAPVVEKGATARKVYFPKGRWVDVWDLKKTYDGPVERTVDAPLGRPPVFSQSGRSDLATIH